MNKEYHDAEGYQTLNTLGKNTLSLVMDGDLPYKYMRHLVLWNKIDMAYCKDVVLQECLDFVLSVIRLSF